MHDPSSIGNSFHTLWGLNSLYTPSGRNSRLALGLLPIVALVHGTAHARSAGMPNGGCSGCHSDGAYAVTVTATPAAFDPGERVRIAVRVEGSGSAVGMHVGQDGDGTFATVSGGGLRSVDEGLTHESPRSLSGSAATFTFDWTAPNTPGAVRFDVWTVLTNGNRGSSGDQAQLVVQDYVFGCSPQTFYGDFDRDGFGRADDVRIACQGIAPTEFVALGDDCDDFRDLVYPGATELCNERDDDCNAAIDDDYVPVMQYPDPDGDGFYAYADASGDDVFLGCAEKGYASEGGDCQPQTADIFPGATEVCNLFDDDCNGRVDERVRPQCGLGWCRRESPTCEAADCVPGTPTPEICNLIDDDCNDVIDEGDLCDEGLICSFGECVDEDDMPTASGPSSSDSGSDSSAMGDGSEDVGDTAGAPSQNTDGSSGCGVARARTWPVGVLAWMMLLAPMGLGRRRG